MALTGRDFELLVKPFFKSLFEKIGYSITEIRNQESGTQNGFDIKVEFEDLNNKKREILIECKYYSSTLHWKEIVFKQIQLWGSNYVPDGFIALSPKENLSNIEDNIQAKINQNQIFGFPADFWTPDKGIEEIFSIDKNLYEKVYGKPLTVGGNEPKVLLKVKQLVEDLLSKRDSILKTLPLKKRYPKPAHYISRKVIAYGSRTDDLFSLNASESIIEVFNKESRIALLGWAGTGKSVELEYLAAELSTSTSQYFPFLITLNSHVDKSLKEYIPDISKIPESNIVLLLDGLDEVQAKDFENTRRRINKFGEDFPAARIIVSCRSNFYSTVSINGNLNTLSGFKSFILSNLSWKNIEEFLDANLPLKKVSFLGEVQSKNLNDLLYYPFYFRRLVDQYTLSSSISNSKAEFFENVITDDISRDVAKYFPQERNTKLIEGRKLLVKLAFILEYQGKNICSWQDLMMVFKSNELDTLKRLGRTLYGDEGDQSIWKFNHNNTQEYLTARFLATLQPEEIKKVIAFPKSYTKVKPTWTNTLSLLFGILPSTDRIRIKLTTWLAKHEPEMFVRFEPERVDENIKFHVLKDILEYYHSQGTRINHSKFNIHDLSKFIKSDKAIDLLIQELSPSNIESAKTNALELISHFNFEKSFPHKIAQVKSKVRRILFEDVTSQYQAMKAYTLSFKLSEAEFDELFNTFKNTNETFLRYALFKAIHHQNYQNKYINFTIVQIDELMRNELESNDGRLSNEYEELKDCFAKIDTLEAIKCALDFVSKNYWRISYSIYFNEIIDDVIKLAIKSSPNEDIYQKLKVVILSKHFSSSDKKVENLKEYFKETANYERIFRDIYSENISKLDYYIYGILAVMANEPNVEFLANEFISSKIERRVVEEFQYYLNRHNSELLISFNTMINKKEVIPLPTYKTFEPIESTILKTKEIVFSKEKFMNAVELVFFDAGKDELSYEDVSEIRMDYEKYLPVISDVIFIRFQNQVVKKSDLLRRISENWDDFSIKRVIDLLRKHTEAKLVDWEIQYVKNWCDKKVEKIDFRKALHRTSPNSIEADKVAIRVSYLIRRLRLSHYRKETYLDMLSFQKWGDSEIDIAEFVASIVPKSDVDQRVIDNLVSGIDFEIVLESHLEYVSNNLLVAASNSLLKYLKSDQYGRYKVLICYLRLEGSISELENILPLVKDSFRHKLFEELISHGSKRARKILLETFETEKDKDEKLILSTHLIKIQSIRGLRYYVNYIKRKKASIDDSSPSNSLYRLTSLWAIPSIIELHEFSYYEDVKQDPFRRISDISLGALQAICRHGDNYPKCLIIFKLYRIYSKLIRVIRRKLPDTVLSNLQYFMESQELEYYTRKSLNIKLEDSVSKYDQLISKAN